MFDVLRDVRVVDLTSGAGGAYRPSCSPTPAPTSCWSNRPGGSAPADGVAHGRSCRPASRTAAVPLPRRRQAVGRRHARAIRPCSTSLAAADIVVEDLPAGAFEATGLLDPPAQRGGLAVPVRARVVSAPAGERLHRPGGQRRISAAGACRRAEPIHADGRHLGVGRRDLRRRRRRWPPVAHRRRTGRGAHIDVSGAEAMMICTNLFQDLMFAMLGGVPPVPGAHDHVPRGSSGPPTVGSGSTRIPVRSSTISSPSSSAATSSATRRHLHRSGQAGDGPGHDARWLTARPTEEVLESRRPCASRPPRSATARRSPTVDHFVDRGIFDDRCSGSPRRARTTDRRPTGPGPTATRTDRGPDVAAPADAARPVGPSPDGRAVDTGGRRGPPIACR